MLSWPHTHRRRRLVALALLAFFLVFTVAWAVAAVFAGIALWRERSHPAVVVFLGAWLVIWTTYPLSLIDAGRIRSELLRGRPWPLPGKLSEWTKRIFFGGFAVGWCAGLAGLLSQGDVGGFASVASVTGVLVILAVAGRSRRKPLR